MPYIKPFEPWPKKRRNENISCDETSLKYIKTPDLVGLKKIPDEYKPRSTSPTRTRDKPLPVYTEKIVETTTISYAIRRTPYLYHPKHCTEIIKIPQYVVNFNKHITLTNKCLDKREILKNTLGPNDGFMHFETHPNKLEIVSKTSVFNHRYAHTERIHPAD